MSIETCHRVWKKLLKPVAVRIGASRSKVTRNDVTPKTPDIIVKFSIRLMTPIDLITSKL